MCTKKAMVTDLDLIATYKMGTVADLLLIIHTLFFILLYTPVILVANFY